MEEGEEVEGAVEVEEGVGVEWGGRRGFDAMCWSRVDQVSHLKLQSSHTRDLGQRLSDMRLRVAGWRVGVGRLVEMGLVGVGLVGMGLVGFG